MMFEKILRNLQKSQSGESDYPETFHKIEIAAKTTLLEEGQIANKLYIVEKGCIRAWYNNNGKDITLQFFFENHAVASIESLKNHTPSLYSIEAIEATTLWYIDKMDFLKLLESIKNSPQERDIFIDSIFERTFDYMKYFFSFIKDSPEQRYLNILENTPQLVQRIPQHYIASYLGISSVHLSRIKSKILKGR